MIEMEVEKNCQAAQQRCYEKGGIVRDYCVNRIRPFKICAYVKIHIDESLFMVVSSS